MDARAGHYAIERKAPQRGLAESPATASDLSGCIPDSPPRSHLLRRSGGDPAGRTAANAAGPRGIRPSAARRGYQDWVLIGRGPSPLLRTLLPLVGRGGSKDATLPDSRRAADPARATRAYKPATFRRRRPSPDCLRRLHER